MISIIFSIIIALAGYPIGLLIARFTDEELEQGRKWFKLIIFVCIIAIIISIIVAKAETLLFLVVAFVFIALLALASLVKSKREKIKQQSKTIKKCYI